jgi:formylglycine-generating enzyme required for sulfatase activity
MNLKLIKIRDTKTKLSYFLTVLVLLSGINYAAAQGARFFRISGPTATVITALQPDGTLVWSNALVGTNYTVQMATSLGGGTNWVDYVQFPAIKAVNTNWLIAFNVNVPSGMALIPAGSFQMGDNLDGEFDAPVHTVYVSGFYIDQNDVTKELWLQVYNWAIAHGYDFDNSGLGEGANHPVSMIDWYDAVKWCNARSEMARLQPAYYTSAALKGVYRTGNIDITNSCVKWNAGYRLPTEAEWEKAARGGVSGQRFPWGNTISWNQANYWGDPGLFAYDLATDTGYDPAFVASFFPFSSPVGYFGANGYRLYDMAGNVEQWCWDWYNPYWYGTDGSSNDPRGPPPGYERVFRGGYWYSYAEECRVACRDHIVPTYNSFFVIGFRSVLPIGK